ncbi:nucleotide disphospho-sugar-binding domain-containing protein [Streptomyces inhibens]|uniref:nucleotide disphospho-sugar-binding domain-containing protein n=1 Tax=Streptomyces inhibens TaxID=2293571 RepID=UPI001EE74531|nr:nucleotide disphospho-sugar-binding domain-containing protein [Streptomyces inhibens]UKY51777.1 DUF1205 domain-containing protein [Streptomyces inhibens]
MRVLAISSPSTTHFMTAVPLMWALRAAGHETMFLGQPDVTGMARAAGLPTTTLGSRFDAGEFFHSLPEGLRPIEAGLAQIPPGAWSKVGMAWVYHAKYLLEPYLEFATAWKPDLIITDPLEYTGLLIGGVLGVPCVHHRWSAEPMSSAGLGLAKNLLHGRARRYGLEEVPDPDVVLDPFPAEWALPDVPAGTPIRPVPYNGGGTLPDWVRDAPEGRRVCASFGMSTVELNGLPLIRHVADAFDGLDGVEGIITLDRAHQELLGPVPKQVRLVEPTPIQGLFEISDAVVHHGGGGSSITALMTGLPQLLMPQLMDQHPRCEQIERSGVGILLGDAGSQNDPSVIREALVNLLDKARYREAAVGLREVAGRLPSPAEVALQLEETAASCR